MIFSKEHLRYFHFTISSRDRFQPSFSIPSSYSFDGKTFQLDVKKDFSGFGKLNHVVSFVPETNKFGNATRLELISSYLRGSAYIDYSAPREAKVNLKGIYGDASAQLNGKLFQPRNFKYTLNPTKNVSLETDFNKFKIGLIQVASHRLDSRQTPFL